MTSASERLTRDAEWTGLGSPPAGTRVVVCEEQGPVDIPLSDVIDAEGQLHLNPEIQHGDYFAVNLKQGALTLRARGYVGYLPLNEHVVVYVRPRVPISNLSRLTRMAGQTSTLLTSLRGYALGDEWTDELVDVYAAALIDHVRQLSSSGLMREYVQKQDVSSFPHGRILMSRTIQGLVSRGINHAVQISWFERTADNEVNRCIKYAVWLIAQRYAARGPLRTEARRLHHGLNASYSVFNGIELDHHRRFLQDPIVTGVRSLPTLRAYYRDALNVALAAIAQQAVLIESIGGHVQLPSLIIDMNSVFEGYVRNVLANYAAEAGWPLAVLNGNRHARPLFRDAADPQATPDILLSAPDGSVALVLEVKNVPRTDRDAINQAVTYAVSFGTHGVVLVHPCAAGQSSGLKLLGHVTDVAVYQYRMDLNVGDPAVEDERFGAEVAQLLAAL